MSTPPIKPIETSSQYVESHTLLQGKSQIVIKHGEQFYRLAVTRENKLILTK